MVLLGIVSVIYKAYKYKQEEFVKGIFNMTQYYYLGAKSPLMEGTFGEKRAQMKNNIIYYETEIDAVSIYVECAEQEEIPRHLRLPYQAIVYENLGGSLAYTENPRPENLKSVESLFSYVKEVLQTSFSIEWYSAWNGEEDEEILHKRIVYADELTPETLFIREREYVSILRSRTW